MAADRKPTLTLLVLRGAAGPTRSLRLPCPRWPAALALVALLFALPTAAGFSLQRAQGPKPYVLLASSRPAQATRFGMFHLIAPRNPEATAAQLMRRAAILHALKLGLGTTRSGSTLYAGLVTPEWQADAERGAAMDGTLLWPVRTGFYVRGYGAGAGGYHLAVDIMGDRGAPVLAAAPGIVGYANNSIGGYGNAIMLVHPGGLITLYAHNERNLVVPGQRVQRGERIAKLGNTGISRGPHVHFELLHGGKNCDPLPLFRPGVRHRPGHLGPIEPALWLPSEARPKAVRCDRRRHYPHGHDQEEGEPLAHDTSREASAPSEGLAAAP